MTRFSGFFTFKAAALWHAVAFLIVPLAAFAADDIPVTMIIKGVVANSADSKIVLNSSDLVQAVSGNVLTGVVESEGSGNEGGAYGVIIANKTSAFKGTILYLRLKRSGTLYPLLNAVGAQASVAFTGVSFFPTTVPIDLVASSVVLSSSSPGTTTPGTTTPGTTTPGGSLIGDINADGKVDDADIALLKKAIAGEIPVATKTMDITGDSVVNTRDLIELIRNVRSASRMNPVNLK